MISAPWLGRFKWGFPYISTPDSRAVLQLRSVLNSSLCVVLIISCAQPGVDGGWRDSNPADTSRFSKRAFSPGRMEPVLVLVTYSIVLRSTKSCFHHCRFLLTALLSRQLPICLSLADLITFHNVYPEKKKLLNSNNKRFFNSSKAFIVTGFLAFFSL